MAMDPNQIHRDASKALGHVNGTLPAFEFLVGRDIYIYFLLGPDNANAIIHMKRVVSGQDGYCGNFDCNPDDDSFAGLQSEPLRGRLAAAPE